MTIARRRDVKGEATTEVVLVTPVLLLLIMTVIQFALWYHAEHAAQAAAQEGARAARVTGGTAARGQAKAQSVLAQAAPTILVDPVVTARRTSDEARVGVRGRAVSLIPGLHLTVSADAASPVERFRGDAP
jgi:Flp pilus assembly protein TadG